MVQIEATNVKLSDSSMPALLTNLRGAVRRESKASLGSLAAIIPTLPTSCTLCTTEDVFADRGVKIAGRTTSVQEE